MTVKSKVKKEMGSVLEVQSTTEKKKCFVIMPIADPKDLSYSSGHFSRVYKEIIAPACLEADFEPHLANTSSESHSIVLHILKSLVTADMVVCDLSTANPNVLYELGIRQMAKKPVALIRDEKPQHIFDINFIRYTNYDSSLRSDLVRDNIDSISKAIRETYENREDNTQAFMDQLGTQLKLEEKSVEVSSTEYLMSKLEMIDQVLRRQNSAISEIRNSGTTLYTPKTVLDTNSNYMSTQFYDFTGKNIIANSVLKPINNSDNGFYIFAGGTFHANGKFSVKLLNCKTSIFESRSFVSPNIDFKIAADTELRTMDTEQRNAYTAHLLGN